MIVFSVHNVCVIYLFTCYLFTISLYFLGVLIYVATPSFVHLFYLVLRARGEGVLRDTCPHTPFSCFSTD